MGLHLVGKMQTFDNAAIEIDEFGFSESVDIDAYGRLRYLA
jgi:hypothetical protein